MSSRLQPSRPVGPDETPKGETWGEILRTILYALLIALAFRVVLFQPFSIPSGSMKSTLLIGDYLFVSKYAYGYSRHALPFSPKLFEGRILAREPERGDVIVFKLPSDNSTDYIKRLVGLPGDRIAVKNGVLFINGQAAPQQPTEPFTERLANGVFVQRERLIETLPNGRRHEILNYGDGMANDNFAEVTVPLGHYFMMGDNRDDSQDSRTTHVGFVPFENFVGRADLIFLSAEDNLNSRGQPSANPLFFWTWRLSRFFQRIE